MHQKPPTDKELAASGFAREDFDETAEVWPENWPSFVLFSEMRTQWNHGFGGPVGLNYLVVYDRLDRLGYAGSEWEDMYSNIQEMEAAALNAMNGNPVNG